jgi:hypothetical protein
MLSAEELEHAQAFHAERGHVVVASPKPLEIDTVIPQGGKSWALNGGFDAYSWRVAGHATRGEMLEFGGKVLGLVEPMPDTFQFFYRMVAAD